jgi:hypothetical protein
MSLADEMVRATESWLREAGGVIGQYYPLSGDAIEMTMVVEMDVQTVDGYGNFTRSHLLSIPSGKVSCVQTSDYVVVGGKRYGIDSILDDPGHIMRLVIQPR